MDVLLTGLLMVGLFIGILYYFYLDSYITKYSQRYQTLLRAKEEVERKKEYYKKRFSGSYAFDTKQKYDNENNKISAFREYLLKNEISLRNALDSIRYNRLLQRKFKEVYASLEGFPPVEKYQWMERRMTKKLFQRVTFDDSFALYFKLTYTSPKGQNHYESQINLSADEVASELEHMEEQKDERTAYEIFRDAERAKMTAGLRYDVLKRDNFTCRMCGANANTHGVTLHVDHIHPVAKGGKTEMDNLQTLCRDCNLGKGTKE